MTRILHTADLHLKHKHPFTGMVEGSVWDRMCEAKLQTLSILPAIAKRKKVDIVTIGGDIFDTSNPPEALKAEFCKILNNFPKDVVVKIIPGRPGDHDYVADNNYVMMDLREAYNGHSNIEIYDKPTCEVCDGVLMTHLMLDGISQFYRHTVSLDDEQFSDYKTVLLGDYHAWYKKSFGKTTFLYPGPPYPTRFGESGHHIAIIEVKQDGKIHSLKKFALPTYGLIELGCIDDEIPFCDQQFVVKYKLTVPSNHIPNTISELQAIRRKVEDDDTILDVVWELKSKDAEELRKDMNKKTIRETCFDYIKQKAPKPKTATKFFKKMEAEL